MSQQIQQELDVDRFTLGLVGPDQEWAGTVADGGTVRTHTPTRDPAVTSRTPGGFTLHRLAQGGKGQPLSSQGRRGDEKGHTGGISPVMRGASMRFWTRSTGVKPKR